MRFMVWQIIARIFADASTDAAKVGEERRKKIKEEEVRERKNEMNKE